MDKVERMSEKGSLATKVAATRAKPAYAGRSATLSRAVAESVEFSLSPRRRTLFL
jgi:hypothetical protein